MKRIDVCRLRPLTLRLGPNWGRYERSTQVWLNPSFAPNSEEVLNLLQRILELNSKNLRMIPDDYRAESINVIIGLRDVFSW
jgi:hypothetical protein